MIKGLYAALLFILTLSTVHGEPVVLFDSGQTVSTDVYKQILTGVNVPDFGQIWATETKDSVGAGKDSHNPVNWLPLITRKLTPGKVKSYEVNYSSLESPVCIIGTDPKSLAWVKKYQHVLLKNNVLCWLVSANNVDGVKKIVNALAGVQMSPANGDDLAKFFHLAHYPVLITPRFIEQ